MLGLRVGHDPSPTCICAAAKKHVSQGIHPLSLPPPETKGMRPCNSPQTGLHSLRKRQYLKPCPSSLFYVTQCGTLWSSTVDQNHRWGLYFSACAVSIKSASTLSTYGVGVVQCRSKVGMPPPRGLAAPAPLICRGIHPPMPGHTPPYAAAYPPPRHNPPRGGGIPPRGRY